jgi:purine-binding chemotaxis protein CheW
MANTNSLQLVSFEVGHELFAAPITKIQEIIRLTNIVKIPKSPNFVEGVINLRGRVIPVIDLKKRFEMTATVDETKARIVVAEIGGVCIGLIVDAVQEVLRPENEAFEETPTMVSGVNQQFIQGIVKQNNEMLIVLDLDKLFTETEATVLKKVR